MARSPAILITGTDTGVGKTYVGALLASAFRARGLSVGVFKPLESDWSENGEGSDAAFLAAAAGQAQPLDDVCLYPFAAPLAPLVAARLEGVAVDVERIAAHLENLRRRFDVVLVEGAGGLLAPLAPDWTILDLAAHSGLSALVVVANRLGCLNHALLTDRVLLKGRIERLGFVFNACPNAPDDSQSTNPRVLASLSDAPVLGLVPEKDLSPLPPETWGDLLPADFDLDGILARASALS